MAVSFTEELNLRPMRPPIMPTTSLGEGQLDSASEQEPWPATPAPFVTQREIETTFALSSHRLAALLGQVGWSGAVRLHLGRGKGSPRIYPLVVLPIVRLVEFGCLDEARQLTEEAAECIDSWDELRQLLTMRAARYPTLAWALVQGDGPRIARGLGAGPDLLRLCERSAECQLRAIDSLDGRVAVGRWWKVADVEQIDETWLLLPLPMELQVEGAGLSGVVIQVDVGGSPQLLYRVGMPHRATPLQPGTTIGGQRDSVGDREVGQGTGRALEWVRPKN